MTTAQHLNATPHTQPCNSRVYTGQDYWSTVFLQVARPSATQIKGIKSLKTNFTSQNAVFLSCVMTEIGCIFFLEVEVE